MGNSGSATAGKGFPVLLSGAAAGCAVLALTAWRRSSASLAAAGGVVIGNHLRLGHLQVAASNVFSRSPSGSSVAYWQLKPILPGHAVVAPTRCVARLADLDEEEVMDLFSLVRTVHLALEPHLGSTSFNLAVKDGPAAGQPLPHVHVHMVPRRPKDLERNDLVYDMIDRWTPEEGRTNEPPPLDVPDDEARRPRSVAEMATEASGFAAAFAENGVLPTSQVAFGHVKLDASQVFYASPTGLTLAVVNLKPLVPGHVLVIPRRPAPKLSELTTEEFRDLWTSVRIVQAVVQKAFGADCSNLGLQDGRDAGQSVKHVHVHILPRGR